MPLRWGDHGLPAIMLALSAVAFGGARAAAETDAPAPAAPASAAANTAQLKSVVVTDSRLLGAQAATVQSVAARSGRQIDESPSLTLEDVVGRMANVSTTYGLTIRGISLFGPNGGNSKTATVTVDGVPQDNYGQDIGGLSVWDASSVEVHRGPQSTVQGRHALAGAVVVKTRNPTEFWDLRGRSSVSDPRGRNLAVAGGGPLAGDLLAFRFSAEDQRDDGGVHNRTRDDRRWNRDDRQTVRGKLSFSPRGTDYRALLTLAEARRSRGSPWVEATRAHPSDRVSLANEPSLADNRHRSAALEQTAQGFGVDWTLLSTWGRLRDDRADDEDGMELRQGASNGSHDDSQQTHELRGHFDSELGPGRLSGVFGAYWSRRRVNAQSGLALPAAYVLTELGVCPDRATCDALYPAGSVLRSDRVALLFTNQALFSEIDYRVGALTFTAGLRHDRETQDRLIDGATRGDTPSASGLVDQLRASGAIAPDGPQRRHLDFRVWLPKLGLSYALAPRWTAGFIAQRGFRAGGVNFNRQLGPQDFGPEFTRNYDVSVKGLVGDGFLLTLNAYRIDWRRQQVDIGTNDLSVLIVNAGRSRLQGFELELRGRAARQLELFAALGVSRTRFTDFTSTNGDFAGKEFTLSPRRTASLGATWKPGDFTLSADVAYDGRTFGNPANDPGRVNPSHWLLNGKLGYALGAKARLFVAGLNLLDERYTVRRYSGAPGRQVVQLSAGRTLRAGFEAEF